MKVALSHINITPKDVIGKPMAGYSRKDPCLGVLDDIYAYAVLIENNARENENKRFLLISIDTLKIPLSIANYIKQKLKKSFNLEPQQILIHATHTHSAPDLTGEFYWPGGALNIIRGIIFGARRNDNYIVWFTRQIEKMVQELFSSLKQCKIAWVKEEFNPNLVINRRHPKRKVKSELGVITFKRKGNNKLLGIIINYSCHPTTLSYLNNHLSADYPGRVTQKINELTNNKVKTIFFVGPAGDLNPITTCGTDFEELDLNKTPVYQQKGTYFHTKKIGFKLAEEALRLARTIQENEYFEELKFQTYTKNFWVPMKDHKYFSKTWYSNKINFALKKYFILPIASKIYENANFPPFTLKQKGFKINCKSIIQYTKFKAHSNSNSKDFSIVTVPGELFEEYGNVLMAKSPTTRENTFIFQNSNDWIAYLFPLKEYVEEGGYEPVASFSPLCGYYVKKNSLKLFREIRSKPINGEKKP